MSIDESDPISGMRSDAGPFAINADDEAQRRERAFAALRTEMNRESETNIPNYILEALANLNAEGDDRLQVTVVWSVDSACIEKEMQPHTYLSVFQDGFLDGRIVGPVEAIRRFVDATTVFTNGRASAEGLWRLLRALGLTPAWQTHDGAIKLEFAPDLPLLGPEGRWFEKATKVGRAILDCDDIVRTCRQLLYKRRSDAELLDEHKAQQAAGAGRTPPPIFGITRLANHALLYNGKDVTAEEWTLSANAFRTFLIAGRSLCDAAEFCAENCKYLTESPTEHFRFVKLSIEALRAFDRFALRPTPFSLSIQRDSAPTDQQLREFAYPLPSGVRENALGIAIARIGHMVESVGIPIHFPTRYDPASRTNTGIQLARFNNSAGATTGWGIPAANRPMDFSRIDSHELATLRKCLADLEAEFTLANPTPQPSTEPNSKTTLRTFRTIAELEKAVGSSKETIERQIKAGKLDADALLKTADGWTMSQANIEQSQANRTRKRTPQSVHGRVRPSQGKAAPHKGKNGA